MLNWLKKSILAKDEKMIKAKIEKQKSKFEVKELKCGFFAIQGEGPKQGECQDTCLITSPKILEENIALKQLEDQQKEVKDSFYLLGVMDGHGSSGKEASNSVSDLIQKYLEKNMKKIEKLSSFSEREEFFQKCIERVEKQLKSSGIDYTTSGSCLTLLFIKDNIVTVINIGDSRAVLCRVGREKAAIELSWDHKPTRKEEKERILKKGGKIERLNLNGEYIGPLRIWEDEEGPGISVTRAIGNFQGKKIGLVSKPEIDHLWLKIRDKFFVIASDGVWEVMNSAEVIGFILKEEEFWSEPDLVAEKLCKEARTRWEIKIENNNFLNRISDYPTAKNGIDDISAVVAFFIYENENEEELEESIVNNIKIV